MTNSAGWYRDPSGQIRYWDGQQWMGEPQGTSEVAPYQPPGEQNLYGHSGSGPLQPGATYPGQPNPGQTGPMHPPPAPMQAVQPPGFAPQQGYGYPQYAPGQVPRQSNGIGIAGFVVSLVSVFLPLIFGFIGGVVGLVLSIVGASRPNRPKGLAIAGIVLGVLAIIFIF